MSYRIVLLFFLLVGSGSSLLGQGSDPHQLNKTAASLAAINPSAAAEMYMKAGAQFEAAYQMDSAVWSLLQARQLYARIGQSGAPGLVEACNALGDIYKYVLYDFNSAEEAYEVALMTMIKLDSKNERAYNRLYYNLATTNRSQLDYKAALTWCRRGIAGAEALHDQEFLERAFSIMGNIYRDMAVYDSARAYYQKGIAVNESLNHGQPNETLAGLLGSLGDAVYRQANHALAGEYLRRSIDMYRNSEPKDLMIVFHTKRLLAEVLMKQQQFEDAKQLLDEANELRERQQIERGGPAAAIYKSYGDWYHQKNDAARALDYYTKSLTATLVGKMSAADALPPVGSIELRPFAYDALLASADLLVEQYQRSPNEVKLVDQALDRYQAASDLITLSRRDLDTEDAKWNYSDTHFQLYERALRAIALLPPNAYHERAFHFVEQSKAKTLSDALREVQLNQALGANGWMIGKLRELRQQSLVLQHAMESDEDTTAGEKLLKNGQEIAQLESQIEGLYPAYFSLVQDQTIELTTLRERLRQLDAVLVEYFVGSDHVYATVVSPAADLMFADLGAPRDIVPMVDSLLVFFHGRANKFSASDVKLFASTSYQLYQRLMKPIEPMLGNSKRLIVSPDGPLAQLPFETLLPTYDQAKDLTFKDLSYLVATRVVSYLPTARQLTAPVTPTQPAPRLLAFGFTAGGDVRAPSDATIDLPGAEVELIALRDKFPDGSFYVGDEVTEANFKKQASGYDLLHLAVHGTGNTGSDYSAALYFRDHNEEQDGKLYWYELYGMNLKAQLAVLSSCESGIGKTYRGEGMLSMANAFTFAGCKNVVMGLWKVDDRVSVELMNPFYSELIEGVPIDEALTVAKRNYLSTADQVSSNPKLWASLVAYGESPVLTKESSPYRFLVVVLMTFIIGGVAVYMRVRK